MNISLFDTANFLKSHDNYLILCHASPDGDTLGSAAALCMLMQKIGKNAKILCPDEIPEKYSYLFTAISEQDFEPQTIVAVDIADTKLLGRLGDVYKDKIDLCIDHHYSNTQFAENLYLDSKAAATCECVYEIICAVDTEQISLPMAKAIYTGISTDTGCFRFSNTTSRSHAIAAKLIELGVEVYDINRIMFETKTRQRFLIEKEIVSDMEFHFDGRCSLLKITQQMLEKTGCSEEDLDGINAISRIVQGVLVGVTLREKQNGSVKISVRTHSPIDASAICQKLGGGGHIRAAGCQVAGGLEIAKTEILKCVEQAVTAVK